MAKAFFKKYAPRNYKAISADTKPSSKINPVVMDAMNEVGIDISSQKSKDITEHMMRNSTTIVNMGCMEKDSWPTLFLNNVIDWNLDDPEGKSIQDVRPIRDKIEQRIKELVASLKTNHRLSSNQKKFVVEVIGTFIVVVFATGSVVVDDKLGGVLGIPFIAFAPFVGVAIGVYFFLVKFLWLISIPQFL